MKRTIDSIQLLRAVAAMLVMSFHGSIQIHEYLGAPAVSGPFRYAEAGVDLFFVISGFIIYTTAGTGSAGRAEFVRKRLLRIYPVYWLVMFPLLFYYLRRPRPEIDTSFFAVLSSITLLPTWKSGAILSVAWTLSLEMIFYVLFACTYFWSRRAFVAALFAWGLCGAVLSSTDIVAHDRVPFCLHAMTLEFSYGVFAAVLYQRGLRRAAPLSLALGLILFAVSLSAGSWTGHGQPTRHLDWGIPAALIVYGAASLSRTLPRPIVLLGDASYVLYLVHLSLISNFIKVANALGLRSALLHAPLQVVLFGAVITTSVALHVVIERPMMRRLNHLAERFVRGRGRRYGPQSRFGSTVTVSNGTARIDSSPP